MLDFPHDYTVVADGELPRGPGMAPVIEFARGTSASAPHHCLVAASRGSVRWTGRFAGDYEEPPAISFVSSSPDLATAFITCAGTGYRVDMGRPERFEIIDCFPICSVHAVMTANLILFGNFTDVVAYGADGVLWEARGLVSDDLAIDGSDRELVNVSGVNAAVGESVRIALDIHSGRAMSS